MIHTVRVLIAAIAIESTSAVIAAPPAQAGESEYLHALQPKYVYLSAQQLLAEGYRVCRAVDSGMNSSDAANMVEKDLAVSVAVSVDIASTAIVTLGC